MPLPHAEIPFSCLLREAVDQFEGICMVLNVLWNLGHIESKLNNFKYTYSCVSNVKSTSLVINCTDKNNLNLLSGKFCYMFKKIRLNDLYTE